MDNDNQTQTKKILSSSQLSLLSHEELVSQLLAAQEKIQELEAKQHVPKEGPNANLCEDVSRYPINGKSQAESIFAYSQNNSTESVSDSDSPYQERSEVIKELQEKLQNRELSGNWLKQVSRDNGADEDFIVAYECKGVFPYCDEDLATPSLSADEDDDIERPKIIINDGLWEDDEYSQIDEIETFPLIPSPVLNTPPYEYIFLTKTNEAKYRIFLNQKLNKVFQEEILKLKLHDEQLLQEQEQSQLVYDDEDEGEDNDSILEQQGDTAEKEMGQANHMDLHNQNHIVNSSSINEVTNNLSSTCNVIHCFDPSDVDLDLKKIFMEKPPITHKIVRRKLRRDRGSSVPAVDSYYGTKDLNKVGHASYFIPTLTESERKAIGWKHEYHYGHWKYDTLNVPNPKNNQISLHPHVEGEGSNSSKHHHNHNNHNGTLPHNPLHHHEIDISEASDSVNDSCIVPPQSKLCSKHQNQHHGHHGPNGNGNEDTLSFITLSGCSREASQSCHIIPDKGTLRKILQCLLPCIKQTAKSTTASLNTTAKSGDQDKDQDPSTVVTVEEQKSKEKTCHEIETLVEPSRKLIFQISNTNLSFIDAAVSGSEEKAHDITNQNRPVTSENDKVHVHTILESEKGESLENHHHIHSHHHHHHGIFHWKNILAHHGHSEESMSVVGGDVVESIHDYAVKSHERLDIVHVETNETSPQTADVLQLSGGRGCNEETETDSHGFSDCTTDSESEDDHGNETTKSFRKLKPCKAFFKLLTLKDIGYETDENDDLGETDNGHEYEDKDGPGRGGNSSNPANEKDISSASSRQEFICRNKRCDELSNRAYKPIRGNSGESGKTHRRGERYVTNRITSWSSNMTGNDYDDGDLSSGGSGYPFSSLSVSHQNSMVGSNILELECDSLTLPEPRTSEEIIEVETRFLDPKDSLTPRMERTLKPDELVVQGHALPFVYDIDNSNTNDEQQEEVKEWMDGDYMEEIEEGLGLLSSCLESIMKHDAIVNAVNEGRQVPDKVEGQHKITTLNDLENKKDGNKNY